MARHTMTLAEEGHCLKKKVEGHGLKKKKNYSALEGDLYIVDNTNSKE